MKKPIFVKVDLPIGYEIEKPLDITTQSNFNLLWIGIGIRRKVSDITKSLKP